MNSLFSFRNKYRSNLSREEIFTRIHDLTNSKSKFLFFSAHQYFGEVSENGFTLSRQRADRWGAMSSRLKGRIFVGDDIMIHTRITFPWLIGTLFLCVSVQVLFSIFRLDEVTLNGELTQADFSLKAVMILLAVVLPACMIFAIAILPAKLLERKLVKLLNLQELD